MVKRKEVGLNIKKYTKGVYLLEITLYKKVLHKLNVCVSFKKHVLTFTDHNQTNRREYIKPCIGMSRAGKVIKKKKGKRQYSLIF